MATLSPLAVSGTKTIFTSVHGTLTTICTAATSTTAMAWPVSSYTNIYSCHSSLVSTARIVGHLQPRSGCTFINAHFHRAVPCRCKFWTSQMLHPVSLISCPVLKLLSCFSGDQFAWPAHTLHQFKLKRIICFDEVTAHNFSATQGVTVAME